MGEQTEPILRELHTTTDKLVYVSVGVCGSVGCVVFTVKGDGVQALLCLLECEEFVVYHRITNKQPCYVATVRTLVYVTSHPVKVIESGTL